MGRGIVLVVVRGCDICGLGGGRLLCCLGLERVVGRRVEGDWRVRLVVRLAVLMIVGLRHLLRLVFCLT